MNRHTTAVFRAVGLAVLMFAWPAKLLAQITLSNAFGNGSLVQDFANQVGYDITPRDESYFVETLGNVVFALLSFIGVVFTILMVYGGYTWMLARGNESEIERAKHIIRSAIIGLVVTLAAYSIWISIAYFLG